MNHDQNQNTKERTKEGGMLTGMFSDRSSTENAYNTLQDKGYKKDDINLIMSEKTRKNHFSDDDRKTEVGTKAAETAGKGSAIGAAVGATAGVIAAIGTSLVLPGIGLVLAGPIAAGLAGAGTGSITGGIVGALIGSGIPEARAKLYESGIEDGQIVLSVKPKNEEDAEFLANDWQKNNGQEIHH